MKEKDANYYNEIFGTAPQYSLECDADNSWHSDLYDFIITLLDKSYSLYQINQFKYEILELGCGTGQFAKKLIDNGFNYKLGIDFAQTGIDLCRKRCPGINFICADLRILNFNGFDYDTVICLETMEHIEKDLEILSTIKDYSKVIISVPSFDDPAHVRFFNNEKEVINRYYEVFSQTIVHKIGKYFVIEAIR